LNMNMELKNLFLHPYVTGKEDSPVPDLSSFFKELRHDTVSYPIIYVGAGTCGISAGANKSLVKIKAFIEERKIDAEILEVGCIGLCSEEPLVDVQLPGRTRLVFRKVTEDKVDNILISVLDGMIPPENLLGQHRHEDMKPFEGIPYIDEHPFFKPQSRHVLQNCGIVEPANLEEYIARGGYKAFAKVLHTKTPAEVCDHVIESGLRGRGGGGFPTGRKWKIALEQDSIQKYMICNADEGDPGAFMDRAVIEGDPYRVLEGLAIASYAIGASKAYIYIRAEYPLAIERLDESIEKLKKFGLLGHNIMDSGYHLDMIIKMGAGAFVCGEETALVHSIEGKRGMPRPRPPFPAVSGLFSRPSIINNVETMANLPTIITKGADWYAGIGTEGSKGTKVFALSGKVNRTGLVEVSMGTTVREIVFDIGGGIPDDIPFKAVQMGGPSGGCIPTQHLDIKIDYESLKTVGAMMGSGGMVVMDEKTCMVDVAKFFMDFIQRESCGKCIPCREGTRQMLHILETITRSRKNETPLSALDRFKGVMQLEELAKVIQDASLCGLGQSAPNPVLSTLRWFRDEYDAHVYERECPAGACPELLVFKIDPDACRGCMICARKCPTGAILGEKNSAHIIMNDKCIGCGQCLDLCKFDAVTVV